MNSKLSSGVLLIVSLILAFSGCSKSESPVQPQATQPVDLRFSTVFPYSGISIGEVSDFVTLNPRQVDQLRGPITELSQALLRDFESDDLDPAYGVEKYQAYITRITGVLSASQRERFGNLVAYHAEVVGFGKDFRHFLRLLVRDLQLTPEQVEQLRGCARTYGEGVKAVLERAKKGDITREAARAEIKDLFDDFITCVKGFLTAEQIEKLETIRQGHFSPYFGPIPLPRQLIRILELTPEQVEHLKGCARTYGEGVKAVLEKAKNGEITRQEARAEVKNLFDNFITCFKGFLTPEQIEKLDRFLRHHRRGG